MWAQQNDVNRKRRFTKNYLIWHIARKGWPYTDFEDLVNLQVLNGAEFYMSSFDKEPCRNFIQNIADFLLDEEIAKKLHKVNFIGSLCDGFAGKSVVDLEVIYIAFMDPDTCLHVMKYFTVVPPKSQDATGIQKAIENSLAELGLSEIKEIIFIASDGASGNSGKDSGLVKLF